MIYGFNYKKGKAFGVAAYSGAMPDSMIIDDIAATYDVDPNDIEVVPYAEEILNDQYDGVAFLTTESGL